ncbi:MAG TPA: GH92 family glycosyl hydrolase [Candidatus Sulfopaludibacter sp.]|jgi:predicted alpha-1,2-mannosidase|nr:GH92 family glycosyl hydrolase [Candidatus Sulfopaludibacter sp.]
MKRVRSFPIATLLLVLGCVAALGFQAAKRPVDYVNALVGTAPLDDPKLIGNAPPPGEELYTGMTSPGAVLPHGVTNLSPVNKNLDLSYSAGVGMSYNYIHRMMLGFTGAMQGLTFMPVVGDWTVPPERTASYYSKDQEKAGAGFYSVYLDDYKVKVEMTATAWTGLYRFTFPKSDRARLLMDMGRAGGTLEVVGDHTVRGFAERGMRGQISGTSMRGTMRTYFVAEFSRPFASFGTFHQVPPQTAGRGAALGGNSVTTGTRNETGNYAGAYLNFTTTEGEQVLVKVASGDSYEAVEKVLEAESAGWNFDAVKKRAEDAWARKLNTIEVKGGTAKERMLFYSNFFHSFASPRLVARKGEQYRALDGQTRTADHDRYGPVPFWDTGRNQIVLLTLVEPDAKVDILASTLDMAKESGYMQTSFHGDHAIFMYLGDWQRGLKFDWEGAYEYLRKNAMDTKGPRRNLAEYLEKGWVSDIIPNRNPSPPYAGGNAGVAKTLEYSWDDYCLATYAKKLGKEDDYQMFLKRAANYKNSFDSTVGFMRGKTADGKWISPFDPKEPYYNFMMKEASGWGTLWLVPHDVQGLANLLGGREKFDAKLDEFFNTPYNPTGICRDCTGMVGQYVQGNQPDQQAPYLYAWGGQPWKSQALVRRILKQMYGSDKSGLAFPGMDDQGSTSSWYVMSAMGFYPVDPARPEYIIGSPIFDEVTIHLGNGKDFVIVAANNSEKNMYIQSATLNGKPWNKPWFSHADIVSGGKLVFQMGPAANKNWGSAPDAAPPSMSTAQ